MFINMGALMKRSRNQSSQMIGFPYLFDQKHPFFWREHHSRGSSSVIHGPFVDDLDDLHFQFPLFLYQTSLQSPFWPGVGLKVSRMACSPAEVATWTKQVVGKGRFPQ